MMDYVVRRMKDSMGIHNVPVFKNLKIIEKHLSQRIREQKFSQDSIYLVSGIEGIGKSTFILHCMDIYGLLTETTININNLTRNIDELMLRIYQLQAKHIVGLDESSELAGDRHGERGAKLIKEKFTALRKRAFIIFIAFTNPLKVNTYFREDRVRGIFHIVKHGLGYFYSIDTMLSILSARRKDYPEVKSLRLIERYAPDYIFNFPKYDGILSESYEARKDVNIDRLLLKGVEDGWERPLDPDDTYISKRQAYKFLGITIHPFEKLIKSGRLVPVWNKGHTKCRISKRDLDNLLQEISETKGMRSYES